MIVYCPEPITPTPDGPSRAKWRFHSRAITSNASPHETGSKSPCLSKRPPFLRSSGVVSRSSAAWTCGSESPFAHRRPRFTGLSGSPFTATTFPPAVATSTPQPTPQKRHGALSHFHVRSGGAPARVETGTAVAAAATAVVPRNSRRVSLGSIRPPPSQRGGTTQLQAARRSQPVDRTRTSAGAHRWVGEHATRPPVCGGKPSGDGRTEDRPWGRPAHPAGAREVSHYLRIWSRD